MRMHLEKGHLKIPLCDCGKPSNLVRQKHKRFHSHLRVFVIKINEGDILKYPFECNYKIMRSDWLKDTACLAFIEPSGLMTVYLS